MKISKFISALLALAITFCVFAVPVMAEENIKVILNETELTFDVPPQLINDRTMVPMRKIFEALGARVEWDEENEIISAYPNDGGKIVMQIGNKVIAVGVADENQQHITFDVAPIIVDSRTLVPVRAVSECMGADVKWDETTQTVIITKAEKPVDISIQEEVTVSTAEEFVVAIGSNKTINVKNGVYDFTPYNGVGNYGSAKGLTITDVKNLSIVGDVDGVTKFANKDTFVEILTFNNCENISISNIKALHTPLEEYQCEGGVFYFRESNNISVTNCNLDGSGSQGISTWQCNDLIVKDTIITNCSLRGAYIAWTDNVVFDNVKIINNRAYANAISIGQSDNVILNNCEISGNKAIAWSLVQVWSADVRINNSIISDNSFELADNLEIRDSLALFAITTDTGSITISNTTVSNNTFLYEKIGDIKYENCTVEGNVFAPKLLPSKGEMRG